MDDDLAWGASVWATSSATTPSAPPLPSPQPAEDATFPPLSAGASRDDGFDDFDDFGAPQEQFAPGDDDDFGDFGDFGDVGDSTAGFADDAGFEEQARLAGPSTKDWLALRLNPLPLHEDLEEQIEEILGPLWANDDLSQVLTDEDIREVGGLKQILVTQESRALYQSLFPTSPPPARPPNWVRSRIRRQHLITLGIPVNLDEVLPHANGKPLPALQITTRPMSAPPVPRHPPHSSSGPTSMNNSRAGTPAPGSRGGATAQLGLGPKPQLEETKIEQLLAITPDQLRLLPVQALDARLAELRSQTVNTSTLLTHLLQTKDALQQDSETYNKLIAELVGEAQKIKSGKSRTPVRRGSGMT